MTPRPLRAPRRLAWLLAGSLCVAGCAMAPRHERPALDAGPAFKEQAAAAAHGVWQPARTDPAAAPAPAWWTVYGDPVLERLQQQAEADNPGLAQSAARLRAALAAVGAARAAEWPTVGATAGSTRSRTPTQQANGSVVPRFATSDSLGLNTSWELDLWGRIDANVSAARAGADASAADWAAARLSLQASVAQAYFALRTAEAQGRLLADTLQAYERSWQLTRNRQAAGVASAADVAQAEAQYQSTQVQWLETRTTRSQLEHALAALLGQVPAQFSVEPTGELPTAPVVPAFLPSELLLYRPDIAAAERRVAVANAQIGVARAAYFPVLSLSASAGTRGAALADLFRAPSLFWSVGPALAASVFDGGARSAAVESARASHAQATAAYRQVVLAALQEVEDGLAAAATLAQQERVQRDALAAAQRALDVVETQYRAGTVGYLNVLSAQAAVLSARRALIDLRSRRLAAGNTLLKNLAGRWPAAPTSP